MAYQDQLVLSGKLNSTGYPIRENVGKSYVQELKPMQWYNSQSVGSGHPILAFSKNLNKDYKSQDADVATRTISWGDTRISYAPDVVLGNTITFMPIDGFQIGLIF